MPARPKEGRVVRRSRVRGAALKAGELGLNQATLTDTLVFLSATRLKALASELEPGSSCSREAIAYQFRANDDGHVFDPSHFARGLLEHVWRDGLLPEDETHEAFAGIVGTLKSIADLKRLARALIENLESSSPDAENLRMKAINRLYYLVVAVSDGNAEDRWAVELLRENFAELLAVYEPLVAVGLEAMGRQMCPGLEIEDLVTLMNCLAEGHILRKRFQPELRAEVAATAIVALIEKFTEPVPRPPGISTPH
jgi:hypothetical protein